MIIDRFLHSEDNKQILMDIKAALLRANVLSFLMETAHNQSHLVYPDNSLETTAQRGAWLDGYIQALRNLASWEDIFKLSTVSDTKQINPTFQAVDQLLAEEEITLEEHGKLTDKRI